MPIYGFQCKSCGAEFETLVRASDKKPACPSCKSTKLDQQLSRIARPRAGGPGMAMADAAEGSSGPAPMPSGHVHSSGCGCD